MINEIKTRHGQLAIVGKKKTKVEEDELVEERGTKTKTKNKYKESDAAKPECRHDKGITQPPPPHHCTTTLRLLPQEKRIFEYI